MKIFCTFLLSGISMFTCLALAQFQVAPCKDKSLKGQSCMVKEFQSNEIWTSKDLMELKKLAATHPELPWMEAIDADKSLVSALNSFASGVAAKDQVRYAALMLKLQIEPNPQDLLEASAIYLKNNPAAPFFLNSSNPNVLKKIVDKINSPKSAPVQVADVKKCAVDSGKYQKIIADRVRCAGDLENSPNSINLYNVLAEIVACPDYGVEQIGVVERGRTRSLRVEEPCAIALKGASASIGYGSIEIKMNGVVEKIEWAAGHDLTNKKNDADFWRKQLIPQIQELQKPVNQRQQVAPKKDSGTT